MYAREANFHLAIIALAGSGMARARWNEFHLTSVMMRKGFGLWVAELQDFPHEFVGSSDEVRVIQRAPANTVPCNIVAGATIFIANNTRFKSSSYDLQTTLFANIIDAICKQYF